jgi:hypothetical protein
MMKRFTTIVVLALAGSVVAGSPAANAGPRLHPDDFPIATVTTPLSGVVAVSPLGGKSAEDDQVALLAGSADHVVFARGANATTDPTSGQESLYVTDAGGHVTSLGTSPNSFGWSIAGDMLTSTASFTGTSISWRNVANGTSGSGSIPSGAYYIGATATGWAYVLHNGLFTKTTAGVTTSLGRPLGNAAGEKVTSGGTGPNGAVVVDATSAVAYVPYADPSHPVTLDTVDLSHSVASVPVYMQCAVRVSDAFCGESFNTFPNSYETGERLSLTGGAPVAVPPNNGDFFDDFAIDNQATATSTDSDFTVTAPNGKHRTTDTTDGDHQVISGFGKIVQTNAAGTDIEIFSAPGQTPAVLDAATPSPIQASEASQTSGRVVYVDDEQRKGGNTINVRSRPVSNVGGHLTLGHPAYIGALYDGTNADGPVEGPVASSAMTVYLGASHLEVPPYLLSRPTHPRSWISGGTNSIQALSGNRALIGSGGRVLDTTSKTLTLRKPSGGPAPYSALWGDEYCYLKASGAVVCIDLATGGRTTVFTPAGADRHPADGEVWVYGNHVAWVDSQRSDRSYVVNLGHPAKRIILPASMSVYSLTSNGILLERDSESHKTTSYYLRGYGKDAATKKVLTSKGPDGFRELSVDANQSVLTWDDNDTIMAAPLPHVSDPPRFLGAPVAPKSMTAGHTGAWRAYLPYSASLSTCSVTISRGHTVLRRLACVAKDMTVGGAVVSWNGRRATGQRVAPGRVTWTVHASNADGKARAGDGSPHVVTGTIVVKH